jgi:hypothetical protein
LCCSRIMMLSAVMLGLVASVPKFKCAAAAARNL